MTDRALDYSRYPQVAGALFRAVQERSLFDDEKLFVDAIPTEPPELVVERFLARRDDPGFDLAAFVEEHFRIPEPIEVDHDLATSRPMEDHIERLWEPLTRSFDGDVPPEGTQLPLPNPHVVPGGRFREMYYWDSYFVAEGVAAAGRIDTVADFVENFAALVDQHGFVPLGNRVYYDSRSQVPLFYRMLRILERERGVEAVAPYVSTLETEYEFWMEGSEQLSAGEGRSKCGRVVSLPDGAVVNRYWDGRAKPRPESYRHDRELAAKVPTDLRPTLFRNVRAACESGWDFSTRWLRDPEDLTTIRTTELVPVDLNAVLYGIESALAEWLDATGNPDRADRYDAAAAARRDAIQRYCWDDDRGFYVDYCWTEDEPSQRLTLAGVVPLFTGAADPDRAATVARRLREEFLFDGGLVTTLEESGQQWDRPNGWAPLHWLAVVGLERYGHDDLADEIAERWLAVNRSVYDSTGEMAEKYDVRARSRAGDSGEYPLQYGFGWTNGVAVALASLTAASVRPPER